MEEAQSRGCTTASAAAAAAALTLSLPVQGQGHGRAGGVVGSAVVGSGVVGSGVVGAADSEKVVGGGGAGVGGREDCWSEAATFTLIQAWGAHYVELNRGNLKQKHWKEVADAVNVREEGKAAKTDVQCKNRLDTLKKKYKLEKIKLAEAAGNAANGSGNGHGSANPSTVPGSSSGSSKWPFFLKLDELIGTSRKHKKQQQVPAGGGEKGVRCAGGSPPPHQQKQEQPQQQQQQLQQRGQRRGKEEETRMAGLLLPAAPAQHNGPAGSGSTKSKESPDMTDSCPHALGGEGGGGAAGAGARGNKNKKSKEDGNNGGGAAAGPGPGLGPGPSDRATEAKSFKKRKLQDGPYKDLARAIIKFGEVYERIESAKQRQLTELEKQRMEFTKDLELQRMQLFIQAQVELAKLKHAKHGGAGNGNCDAAAAAAAAYACIVQNVLPLSPPLPAYAHLPTCSANGFEEVVRLLLSCAENFL